MTRRKRALADRSWTAVVGFFRGYLHQDAADEHGSIEDAFSAFWRDASDSERRSFAGEWRSLMARTHGRAWRRIQPSLSALGLAWMPDDGSGFSRLRKHVERIVAAEGSRRGPFQ